MNNQSYAFELLTAHDLVHMIMVSGDLEFGQRQFLNQLFNTEFIG